MRNRPPSVDGTELPQHVVDEIARSADRVLLPLNSAPVPPGGRATLRIELTDVPRFYLVSLCIDADSRFHVEELSIDGQVLARDVASSKVSRRWQPLRKPARPGSEIVVELSNPSEVVAALVGGILVAVTEDGEDG